MHCSKLDDLSSLVAARFDDFVVENLEYLGPRKPYRLRRNIWGFYSLDFDIPWGNLTLRKQLSVRPYVCYVFLSAADTKPFELQKWYRPFWKRIYEPVSMVPITLGSDPRKTLTNVIFFVRNLSIMPATTKPYFFGPVLLSPITF